MFIYESRKVFDESGEGPLRGLIVKTTPNGYKDFIPVEPGKTVIFFEENEEGINFNESFVAGEASEEGGSEPEKEETPAATQEELIDAIANAEDGAVIALQEDMEISSPVAVNKELTINLNNKKVTSQNQAFSVDGGSLTLKKGEIESTKRSIWVGNGGSLTVTSTNITSKTDCAIDVTGAGSKITVEGGTITAQEVPVLLTSGGEAEITGGHLIGLDNFAIGGNGSAGKGDIKVTITGGVIEGRIQSAGYTAAAIYWPNSGELNISGGQIISEGAGIVQRGGTVNIESGDIQGNGPAGFLGKVGDSRVVVGSYAIVFDKNSKYPAMDTMQLNIEDGVLLHGTDGDIQVLPEDAEGINDMREKDSESDSSVLIPEDGE